MRTTLLLGLFLAPHALAAPGYVPVQGVLTDVSGARVDGQVDVSFTLFSDGSATTSLWTETLTLDVVDGAFATELGGAVTLDLDTFASYREVHLQVQVVGDSPMPLVPFDHVPYAAWSAKAGDAATLQGVSAADLRSEIPLQSDLESAARDVAYDTEAELHADLDDDYLPSTYTPAWTAITDRPAGLDDGDDVRSQAEVEAWARGVCFDDEQELHDLLDPDYLPSTYVPAWSAISGRPAGLDDGDDDTQLTETQVDAMVANNGYAVASTLAAVATSGSYGDLSGTPSLAAVATSGSYGDLSGTPSLAAVATSGSYGDLSGTPSLAAVATSGSYNDLADVPTRTTHYFVGSTATPTEWQADVIFNQNYTRFCEAIGKSFVSAQTLQSHYTPGETNGFYYDGWYYTGHRACDGDAHVWGNGDPGNDYNVWRYDRSVVDCGCCLNSGQWAMETAALITCE